ncbi:MAG: hypothetical protein A2Y73_06065 [Chloroflexi bacterium RBG_13_56_8]|nr:MAG: hypothetical protein A2Y73_06065 [Chloroflexi bacterium RBG_13_56_8]
MNRKQFAVVAAIGCSVLVLIMAGITTLFFFVVTNARQMATPVAEATSASVTQTVQEAAPTFTLPVQPTQSGEISGIMSPQRLLATEPGYLADLYNQVNPGVVNIQVTIMSGGTTSGAAGSGFIIDTDGHIVTNNHVVENADFVTVVFYNGIEAEAQIIGTDADSDLAIVKVDSLSGNAHPLSLGDSDQVQIGEWAVAIGNPFALAGSMTLGIVSAVGRTIPSGVAQYSIPQAIQTDAAINPGNSGGPLLNLDGEVIGVNAQIASGGSNASAGVGFAIPSNIVKRVSPSLIQNGSYQWPWLGIEGGSLSLLIAEANDLSTQQGAYINSVAIGSPAANVGLQGSTGTTIANGVQLPVGGDVVIKINEKSINNMSDLLTEIALQNSGDEIELTILRNGQQQKVPVTLTARPSASATGQ